MDWLRSTVKTSHLSIPKLEFFQKAHQQLLPGFQRNSDAAAWVVPTNESVLETFSWTISVSSCKSDSQQGLSLFQILQHDECENSSFFNQSLASPNTDVSLPSLKVLPKNSNLFYVLWSSQFFSSFAQSAHSSFHFYLPFGLEGLKFRLNLSLNCCETRPTPLDVLPMVCCFGCKGLIPCQRLLRTNRKWWGFKELAESQGLQRLVLLKPDFFSPLKIIQHLGNISGKIIPISTGVFFNFKLWDMECRSFFINLVIFFFLSACLDMDQRW